MPVKWTGWEFAERVRDEDVAPPLYLPFGHRDAARRSTARINLSRRRAGGHQRGEQAPRPDYRANRVGAKATLVCRHRRLRPVRACRRYKEETSLVSEARTPGAAVSEQRPHDYAALHGNRRGEDHNLHTFDEFVGPFETATLDIASGRSNEIIPLPFRTSTYETSDKALCGRNEEQAQGAPVSSAQLEPRDRRTFA